MRITEPYKIRILYFLVLSCTASWLPIFADYLKDQGLNGIQIGTILSITPFMMFAVQPMYGIMADRIGIKRCLLASSLLASICFGLFLVEGGFVWLFSITMLMSLFYNSIQPLLDSLSLALADQNKKINYGSIRIAGALGWAVTGTIVGYFVDSIDTSVIFTFSAISMGATFLFAFLLPAETNQRKNVRKEQQSVSALEVIQNKQLLLLLFCVLLVSAGATTIWNFYSIYMKENGASAALVGYGLSIQGLSELPMFFFATIIINRLQLRATLIITVLATAIRLFLYSRVNNTQLVLFVELLHGLSWSLFWVVCVECVNKLVVEKWRATGQSLLYAAYFGIGAIVGNFWTGYLYDTQMKISDIFLLNSILIFAVAIFIWVFIRDLKDENNAQPLAVHTIR